MRLASKKKKEIGQIGPRSEIHILKLDYNPSRLLQCEAPKW